VNTDANRAAIVRAAQEMGVDPSLALAVAERESSFNPHDHADKTIYGMFQMTKGERDKHGSGDSDDPYTQARSWMHMYQNEIIPEMRGVLGRDPTGAEAYLGHHFGNVRAARMITRYDPDTPTSEIFSPREMALNPHFGRAGTSGRLMSSITSDIGRRQTKFGGQGDYSEGDGSQADTPDFSSWGTPMEDIEGTPSNAAPPQQRPPAAAAPPPQRQASMPNFSAWGTEGA
jgi:hypothetical protein